VPALGRFSPSRRLIVVLPVILVVVIGAVVAAVRLRTHEPVKAAPTPVVQVGSTVVNSDTFDARLHSALIVAQQGGAPLEGSPSYAAFLRGLRARVLQSLVIDAVIAEEAKFLNLAAGDAEVASQLAAEAQSAGGSDKLQTQLAELGGSLEQERDQIRSRLNEERIQDSFAQQRAASILTQLRAGGDFAALAQGLSDDEKTRANGGDLGSLSVDQIRAAGSAFAAAALALAPGQLTDTAARDDAGYEVLRLDAATATTRSLHRILVAAPRPYTVRERPAWFAQSVLDAVARSCAAGRVQIFVQGGEGICGASSTPTPGATSPAPSPTPTTPAPTPTPAPTAPGGFTPRP
jgi:parvulin-like peptidyl-prolyl isomerase